MALTKTRKWSGAEFLYGTLKIDLRLIALITAVAVVAVAVIGMAFYQKDSDCDTQTDILIKKIRQLEESEEHLIREREKQERVYDIHTTILGLKIRQLEESEENLIREREKKEKDLDSLMENILDKSYLLKRPLVELSRAKYNADKVHINDEGELINKPRPNPPHSEQRLKKYGGTSSTVPLTQSGYSQYWEVKTQVDIIESLKGASILLEIALASEKDQDQGFSVLALKQSFSLFVKYCTELGSICMVLVKQGWQVVSLPVTLENTPGASTTLHYGVVYDSSRQRIAFLDLNKNVVIGKIQNVDSYSTLWPMFGVYHFHLAAVHMSLVVGNEIEMTQSKKNLILESLN